MNKQTVYADLYSYFNTDRNGTRVDVHVYNYQPLINKMKGIEFFV